MRTIITWLVNHLDPIAKIIFGSGLIAFSIKEIAEARRRNKLKKRIEEELASELFLAECAGKLLEKQFDELSIRPDSFARKFHFSLVVMKSLLSSGSFLLLGPNLVHLIVEYTNRLENFNRELKIFYDLKGEAKKFSASGMRSEAYVLWVGLQNSKELIELRTKYFKNWHSRNENRVKEMFG